MMVPHRSPFPCASSSLVDNTTPALVADMEQLRLLLGIEAWHLFGGSWGSTLAVAYAVAHPAHTLSLVLRGVFLCSHKELDWYRACTYSC